MWSQVVTVSFLLVTLCVLSVFSHSSDHDHEEHDDNHVETNPAFKYSKEAQERFDRDMQEKRNRQMIPPSYNRQMGPKTLEEHRKEKLEQLNQNGLPPPDHHKKPESKVHSHNDHQHHEHKPPSKNLILEGNELWLYAMGSTLLISAAPFLILFLVPLDKTDQEQPKLKILLAFASGGLLGDAFLHLIPHATMQTESPTGHSHLHSHSHSHEVEGENHAHDMTVGLWVLAGILAFLVVEKSVRIIKGSHGHSHGPAKPKESSKIDAKTAKSSDGKSNTSKPKEDIKVAGYLNLAADFSHNFTDGLAIGSSYLAGNTVGIVTTITILLHEVPHEIGDFAILLQSGVSRKNAMLLQLTTALGAIAGTAISLFAQDAAGALAVTWILPFTAGGFIYIALVSVIPELLDEEKPTILQTLLQIGAMLVGVGMMVLVAEYE